MTLVEIVCVCMDVQDERKRESASPAELQRYIQWWSAMMPEEQLWAESYE